MAKDDALLKRIFKDGAVGEKRKELEENRKREEEEQKELLRRAGEVGALFDECGEIYGKKRYKARVAELIEYLNDKEHEKEHAIEFWKNPHIKMIYNISDHNNFLLSIYTEETDNVKYEEWLRKHFSNPFFTHTAANPIMFKTLANTDSQGYYRVLESSIDNLQETQNEHNRFTLFVGDDHYLADSSRIMIKAVPGNSLLDVEAYTHLVNVHADLPSYYDKSSKAEYVENIYSYNPLILMNNNFLRLDTYNNWRNKFKKYWKEVNQRDSEMFAILDALVKSRKIYLKERKK